MDGLSLNITQTQIDKLKALFPEAVSEGKVDWERLRATLGEDVTLSNERYVLNWAGKSDAFRALQTPTTKTLMPAKDESVDWDTTQHIFIEGENLEVLKVLQKSYFGKVKMIYIDPPYNTGNDSFIYPDKFSETKDDYLRRVGDKDEEGHLTREGLFSKNSKENGQYHSNWLSMMYPRLFLAKNLLRQDGVIFVSIDDNEVHNLRLLMNEVFGEENFVANFIWEKRLNRENRKEVSVRHDYIMCFAKNSEDSAETISKLPMSDEALSRYSNPDNDSRGPWKSDPAHAQAGHGTKSQFYTLIAPNGRKHELQSGRCWVYTKEVMDEAIKDGRIWFGKGGNGVPRIKTYLDAKERGLTPETIWFGIDASTNEAAKNRLKTLFNEVAVFETPKPVELLKIVCKLALAEGIVLDFFAGSGAIAESVYELNAEDGGDRRYICVQLPEPCDAQSEAAKAGYGTIAEISKERIRRAGKKVRGQIAEEIKKKEAEIAKLEKELGLEGRDEKIGDLQLAIDNLRLQDTGFKVLKLTESNFKQWRKLGMADGKALEEQMKLFIDPVKEGATEERMVYELLLKSGLGLNSEVRRGEGRGTGDEGREKDASYYTINDGELVLLLEKAEKEVLAKLVAEVVKLKPRKVVALDRLFEGNDQLKTNTMLQMKDAGVEFRTI